MASFVHAADAAADAQLAETVGHALEASMGGAAVYALALQESVSGDATTVTWQVDVTVPVADVAITTAAIDDPLLVQHVTADVWALGGAYEHSTFAQPAAHAVTTVSTGLAYAPPPSSG